MFKRRRFPVEIILVCVRWYCKYGISYRDLAEMMHQLKSFDGRVSRLHRLKSKRGFDPAF